MLSPLSKKHFLLDGKAELNLTTTPNIQPNPPTAESQLEKGKPMFDSSTAFNHGGVGGRKTLDKVLVPRTPGQG